MYLQSYIQQNVQKAPSK